MIQTIPIRKQAVFCLAILAAFILSTFAVGASDNAAQSAASATKPHAGVPTDWSSHHLVMTGDSVAAAIDAGDLEPRHVYNRARRMQAVENLRHRPVRRPKPLGRKIDWAVSLENGFMPAAQYPAKYRFDTAGEDCNSDYVLFTLMLASGTGGNLVGINNLYTEANPKCNGGSPWVSFAYFTRTHTGGQNRTSPVLSLDGTKVGFVESTNTASYFHILVLPNPIPAPPSHTGTVISPTTPSTCTNPITAGCMSTLQISASPDTLSAPWVDYATDTAYVGTNDGKLYKISPVFGGGAPALVNDADWPVTVVTSGTSKVLTAAVVDNSAGRIFVGDGNGYLYAVSLTGAAHATAARLSIGWIDQGAGTAIVDAPVVVTDISNPGVDQVFSFTGCSNIIGIGAAINQVPANFTSASTFTTVDMGSSDGGGNCTGGNAHGAAFDDAFWTNGTATGHIMGCGFVSGTAAAPRAPSSPKMYKFAFDVTHNVTAVGQQTWAINNSLGDECAPLTEFSDGVTDRVFFGVGGTNDGFIESSNLTNGFPAPTACTTGNPNSTCSTAPNGLGGTSGITVDNTVGNGGMNIYFTTLGRGSVNGQSCHVSGGTATPYCAVKLTQTGLN